ncbi:ABC transporter permease [Xanthovirga aplysinae]|uniref:ABC transporter permease n=1 Tax=Xanthovirga aplysinae TaxID=2529853 RepID=UPI0012BC373C|nr:ABC transporter permease [Xanthovirga aplysinae]MTI33115.1 ABC transporter permease [Xanthovirga aplysinae]
MLKLNLLLAIRKLKKDKKSFLINLIGSSIGLTAVFLMTLYISYENNYDGFQKNNKRLYRIERTVNDKAESQIFDSTPYELADELKSSFPEIADAASVISTSKYIAIKDELFPRENGLFADGTFLHMFSFEFLQGNHNSALSQPMSIVLSKSLADKLFPTGNAVGKTVRLDKKHDFNVTGVFADYPKDSHLTFKYIISYNSYEGFYGRKPQRGWDKNYTGTYVLLNDKAKVDEVDVKIKNILAKHTTFEEGSKELLSLRPIKDIYLKTLHVINNAVDNRGNDFIVIYLFIGVALFTAFITAVNYINLSTTQLLNRELEIGMKKVLGVSKPQLRFQFIIESFLMLLAIVIVTAELVYFTLPIFNRVVDRDLSLLFNGSWFFLLKFVMVLILFGFLGGLYPVYYLSSLKLSAFLHGHSSIKRRNFLRKALVVFQLLIAIPLLFFSLFVMDQINYLRQKDIGFEKENLLFAWVPTPDHQAKGRLKVLKNTLEQDPNVLSYSESEGAPFIYSGEQKKWTREGAETYDKIRLSTYAVDHNFLDAYKMSLAKGRWFSEAYSTDGQNSCIINEAAALSLGWENPIGKTFDNGRLKIIGVVKNFHQYSLFQKIPPIMLLLDKENNYPLVSVKVNPVNKFESQKKLNELFNASFLETPIEFEFLETGFDEGYMMALQNVMRIFVLFSVISIVLVIIGLFGLISFSLNQQKKAIAIRKVLGGSTKNIFIFILKDYMKLYAIATAVSLLLTYFTVMNISQTFAYSVGVKSINLLSVILITLFIVLMTVSGKIWSVSKENPLNAINRE